jgi:hypothetical protein
MAPRPARRRVHRRRRKFDHPLDDKERGMLPPLGGGCAGEALTLAKLLYVAVYGRVFGAQTGGALGRG